MKWLSTATIPRDGSIILLLFSYGDGPVRVSSARFGQSEHFTDGWFEADWSECIFEDSENKAFIIGWMPFPEQDWLCKKYEYLKNDFETRATGAPQVEANETGK